MKVDAQYSTTENLWRVDKWTICVPKRKWCVTLQPTRYHCSIVQQFLLLLLLFLAGGVLFASKCRPALA